LANIPDTPNPVGEATPHRSSPPKWPILILVGLGIFIPAQFWRQTWFGRPMTNAQIRQALGQTEKPRKIQHALDQLSRRIQQDPKAAAVFHEPIVSLAPHPQTAIRAMAAWVMGEDNRSERFRLTLIKLLEDPEPVVRYNAALALSRFNEPQARPVLLAMLQPYPLQAPCDGTVKSILPAGDSVSEGSTVARFQVKDGIEQEILSPLSGWMDRSNVSPGATIETGHLIGTVRPEPKQILSTLQALYLIGKPEDLPAVTPYTEDTHRYPPAVASQARLTAEALRSRAAGVGR
jgi:hypothetical protein